MTGLLLMLRLRVTAAIQYRVLVRIPPQSRVRDLFRLQLAARGGYDFVGQYIGAVGAPFLSRARAPAGARAQGEAGARSRDAVIG
jgi:hypothetical protein